MALVGQERERQVVLVLELAVRRLAVGRDAEDDRSLVFELAVDVSDPARLGRAAWRVVLGIKIQYDRSATKGGQGDVSPVVSSQGEVGSWLAFAHHVEEA